MPGTQVNGAMSMGGCQPPRNMIVIKAHMRTIDTYSESMKRRYGVDEYSTMKPATSSDSASGRSKGGRLVSASAEMKKTTAIGRRWLNRYQWWMPPAWAFTICERFNVPAVSRTVMITKPIETS